MNIRRKLITAALALVALLAVAQPAEASWIYNGTTQLNSTQWTPLPDATNHVCIGNISCVASFSWFSPAPTKDTTIRIVGCSGNETGRWRIPANSATYYNIGIVSPGGCARFQGRMSNAGDTMNAVHAYTERLSY